MPPDRKKFRPSRLGYDYHTPRAARLGHTHEQQQDNPFRLTSQGSPLHTTQVSSPIVRKRATKVVDLTASSALGKPKPQLSLFKYLASQGGPRLPAPATFAHRDLGPSNIGAASAIGKTRFVCSYPGCGEDFAQRGDRKRHVEAVHENKRFLCPRCGKDFTRQNSVTIHLRDIKKPCKLRIRQLTPDVSSVQHAPSPPGHNLEPTHNTPPVEAPPFTNGYNNAEDAAEEDDDDDIDGHSLRSSPVAKLSSKSFPGLVFAKRPTLAYSAPPVVNDHPPEQPGTPVRRAYSPIDLCSPSPPRLTVVELKLKLKDPDPRTPTTRRTGIPSLVDLQVGCPSPAPSRTWTSPDVPLLHEMQKERVAQDVDDFQRHIWGHVFKAPGAGGGGSNKENQGTFDHPNEEEEERPGTPVVELPPMEGEDEVGFVRADGPSFSNVDDEGRDAYGDYFPMDEYDVIHDAYDRDFANIAQDEEDALDVELLLGHNRGPCSSPPMRGSTDRRVVTFANDDEESEVTPTLASSSTASALLTIARQQPTAIRAANYITQADFDTQDADLAEMRVWCQAVQARKRAAEKRIATE